MPQSIDPLAMIVPRRKITGISAILLPFTSASEIDWPSFDGHVLRTAEAGLTPAVNMDTGYVNLLDDTTRVAVLTRTKAVLGGRPFVAGAFVGDTPNARWNPDAYSGQIDPIQQRGGIPVIFPSFGLTSLPDNEVIAGACGTGTAHATDSLGSNWGRCSHRSDESIRWKPIVGGWEYPSALARSIPLCNAISNGSDCCCEIRCGPIFTSSLETTWPSTWSFTEAIICSD